MKKFFITLIVVICCAIIIAPILYFVLIPQEKDVVNVYGVDGIGHSITTLTRTDDAEGMSYSFSDGFKSDFSKAYPWSEMKTIKDEYDNVFVKIPKFYSKFTANADGSSKLQISDTKLEGFTTLFRDDDGNEIDYIMVGAYEATGSKERIYSKPGDFPLTRLNIREFRSASEANGKNYHMFDYSAMMIINQLFTVEFATTDSQSIFYGFAYNYISGTSTTGLTDVISGDTGYLENGAFKYRGIENIWGNTFKFVDGIYLVGTELNYRFSPSNYGKDPDASKVLGTNDRMEGWGRGLSFSSNSLLVGINGTISLDVGTPYNLSDYIIFNGSNGIMAYGGCSGYGNRAGAWCWYLSYTETSANGQLSTRLCYKPVSTFSEI